MIRAITKYRRYRICLRYGDTEAPSPLAHGEFCYFQALVLLRKNSGTLKKLTYVKPLTEPHPTDPVLIIRTATFFNLQSLPFPDWLKKSQQAFRTDTIHQLPNGSWTVALIVPEGYSIPATALDPTRSPQDVITVKTIPTQLFFRSPGQAYRLAKKIGWSWTE